MIYRTVVNLIDSGAGAWKISAGAGREARDEEEILFRRVIRRFVQKNGEFCLLKSVEFFLED